MPSVPFPRVVVYIVNHSTLCYVCYCCVGLPCFLAGVNGRGEWLPEEDWVGSPRPPLPLVTVCSPS